MFVRAYVDNEVEEEDKKLHVERTRESMPFGMHIRKAAYKAAFGVEGSNPVLQRYATQTETKKYDAFDDLSENSSSSESVSESSDGFDNLEIDPSKLGMGAKPKPPPLKTVGGKY